MSNRRTLLVEIAILAAVGAACTTDTSLGRSGAGGAPTDVGGVPAEGGAMGSGAIAGGTGGSGTGGAMSAGTGGSQSGGTTAAGGSTGIAGSTGVGGTTRTGGEGGSTIRDGGPVDTPMSGGAAGSVDASTGGAGGAGTGGTAIGGAGGAGTGGTAIGGAGGAGTGGTAIGGAGGSAACQQAAALDQSCLVDSDCLAVLHTTNCCGSAVWLGINKAGAQEFSTLEATCDASYPRCGCGTGVPTASDGSSIAFGDPAAVTCQGGVCKTYASACGHPCETGRSCITCGVADGGTSVCTLHCPDGTGCTESAYSKCQSSVNGSICVSPDLTWCTGY